MMPWVNTICEVQRVVHWCRVSLPNTSGVA